MIKPRVLYAIQGTGNGHVSRARDIIPILTKKAKTDILISGNQSEVQLNYPIKYSFKGLSFIFGKNGGVDYLRTMKNINTLKLLQETKNLPVKNYDLIINDFEPISSWACFFKEKKCISLSHQAAVISNAAPKPKNIDPLGWTILKKYAPTTKQYGFHFERYNQNTYTPVIRSDIRKAKPTIGNYVCVYLPSYNDAKIINTLSEIDNFNFVVFSKHTKNSYRHKNLKIQPVNGPAFGEAMLNSCAVLTGAGFETPAEALYLKKKLMVIPMKNQVEQHCNAAALKNMGIPVIKSLKKKHLGKIRNWLENNSYNEVIYPDETEQIIDHILQENL